MTSAVFISGFDFETPEDVIESHFASVGSVKEVRYAGKGSAVVSYDSAADADRAVDELNNSTMEGNRRYVTVRLDKGKGKGGGEKGKSWDKGGGKGKYGDRDKGKGGYSSGADFDGELLSGTVANFIEDRGFGFITPDEGGDDVYVHFTAIQTSGFRTLKAGQPVSYGLGEDPKGKGKGKGKAVFCKPEE
eukprot:CAMPEP_0197649730 /NCGR_PEP_ID=MMETSP1338-20131121/29479_1 /TAXON_ID=43686 ORGANISM="Pelagodinium beii, Strain RCC1491" /NCGR_SAMPLE_ID=MMETSP1338 /ASSEMBLY_ACC=CAM_ASM_000754 /LENGTH=189 /DNA_ID=CAMNT_0043223981 /DNA_START=63 /DNA_END=632 /DNA_ORIENTATION=+